MDAPTFETICGACKHKFGKHYTTYDDAKDGCTNVTPGSGGNYQDYTPTRHCECTGFALVYRPIRPKIMSQAELTAAYYDK